MKIGYVSLLVICFLILPGNSPAQEYLRGQFEYAVNLYEEEKYFDAVTELIRLDFFDSTSAYSFEVNYLAGLCYKKGAELSDAIYYFSLAELNAYTDYQLFDSKIQQVRCNILRRTTGRALDLLHSLSVDERFVKYSDQISYWRGWAYIFGNRWEDAAEEFSSLDSAKQLYEIAVDVSEKSYSSQTAKMLSYFVPGAGQFYTGNYFSGVLSFGWNLLWGYLTIEAFLAERIFDGFAIANFLWLRFYTGNLFNAEKFANEENLKVYNEALHYLQHNFSGTKP